jgi:hypothetical protein
MRATLRLQLSPRVAPMRNMVGSALARKGLSDRAH